MKPPLTELEQANLGLALLADREGADIVLTFDSARSTSPECPCEGGRGEASVVRDARRRVVFMFTGSKKGVWGKNPATGFGKPFADAFRIANARVPLVVCLVLFLLPATPAFAQGEAFAALIPTELSVGAGATIEWNPGQGSVPLNFGLSRAWVRDQWIDPALEMGLGPWSNEPPCLDENLAVADAENCIDGYILFGPRFRPLRESDRLWRPFVQFLLGAYWNGAGQRDREFLDSNLAIQAGGGVDLRKPTSIHGLRLSGDYRRVFAEEQGRHQLQFVVSYFVGWRGPAPGSSSPSHRGRARQTGGMP